MKKLVIKTKKCKCPTARGWGSGHTIVVLVTEATEIVRAEFRKRYDLLALLRIFTLQHAYFPAAGLIGSASLPSVRGECEGCPTLRILDLEQHEKRVYNT